MKTLPCVLLAASAFIGSSYGCANQAVYDLCLKTGQAAMGACGAPGTNPKCACAAQKQILACYSECPDDANVFQLGQIQAGQVQVYCGLPGAEPQVPNAVTTKIMAPSPTMASPIHATATEARATGNSSSIVNNDSAVKVAGTNPSTAVKQDSNSTTQASSDARRMAWDYSVVAVLGFAISMAL